MVPSLRWTCIQHNSQEYKDVNPPLWNKPEDRNASWWPLITVGAEFIRRPLLRWSLHWLPLCTCDTAAAVDKAPIPAASSFFWPKSASTAWINKGCENEDGDLIAWGWRKGQMEITQMVITTAVPWWVFSTINACRFDKTVNHNQCMQTPSLKDQTGVMDGVWFRSRVDFGWPAALWTVTCVIRLVKTKLIWHGVQRLGFEPFHFFFQASSKRGTSDGRYRRLKCAGQKAIVLFSIILCKRPLWPDSQK